MKTIGERIQTIRKNLGLSALEFGQKIGVLNGAVYKYENNKAEPNTMKLQTIANLGQVTLDWLITGHEAIHTGKTFFNDGSPCSAENLGYYAGQRLSDDERQMLNLFRKLDMREYGSAMRALELIVETSKYPLKNKDLPIKP